MTVSSATVALIGVVAVAGTAVVEPCLIGLLRRRGVIDRPTSRSSHSSPTVRGGGVAIAGVSLAVLCVVLPRELTTFLLLAELLGLALLGLIDDLRSLRAITRLLVQTALGAAAVAWSLYQGTASWPVLSLLGAVVLVGTVATVNAFNFMDGINGISTAQSVVVSTNGLILGFYLGRRTLAELAVVVGASALTFGPFNFPRARVFLGDSGSYFLGASAAAMSVLELRAGAPVEAALAPLVLYFLDTATTIGKRVLRHEYVFEPHREHTYQRATQAGWSHTQMTSAYVILELLVAALGTSSLSGEWLLRPAADGLIAVTAVAYLSIPQVLRRRETRRRPRQPAS